MKCWFMKKIFLLTLFGVIFSIVLFIILCPSAKENSFKIMMYYYMNQSEFNSLKKELLNQDYESMTLAKKHSSYELTIDKKQFVVGIDELKKNYKDIASFLEKFDIEYVQKEKDNIIINFNSQINFAQNIVYLNDFDDYEYRHNVEKKRKLKNNWYYIEGD